MNISTIQNFVTILAASSGAPQCVVNADCPALYHCMEGFCEHKGVFPLEPREFMGSVLMMVFVGIANAAGQGGSFIAAPILMIIFNYDPGHAIRLVYCVVFGGSLGNFLINFLARRDPSPKPLIDYDVSLIALPMLLCGTSVGVMLNNITPPAVTIIGLVYLMTKTFFKLYGKFIRQRARENVPPDGVAPDMSIDNEVEMKEWGARARSPTFQNYFMVVDNPRIYQLMKEDKLLLPWRKYREIIILIILIVGMFLLKGTSTFKSILGITYCSTEYWILYALTLGVCFLFERRARGLILEDSRFRENSPLSVAGDFTMTPQTALELRNVSLVGGTLAGFLGIGGGTVMNPTMLDMGLSPESAAATSGFFVIFTGFLSMFQTLLYGGLSILEISFFSPIAFFGSLFVSAVVRKLVKKYNRPSIVLFLLLFTLVFGIVAIPSFSIFRAIQSPSVMLESHGLC